MIGPITFKILKQHERGCHALDAVAQGRWSSPWWIPGETVRLDRRGGNTGSTYTFLQLKCNSITCDARAIISEEWVLDQVAHGIERGEPGEEG